MRPSLLASTLESLFSIRRTVLIEGSPGVGKTSVPRMVAAKLGWQYVERHIPTMIVEDFGVPKIGGPVMEYTLPDWYPAKGSKWDTGTPGVLCFDDASQGASDLQKVMANLIQARNLHGVPMLDNWTVVATGNRVSDRAGANRLLSHLRNRLTALQFTVDPQDWHTWALNAGVHLYVRAFLKWKESMLNKFDPNQEACPTPRSWAEAVSPIIGLLSPEAEYEVYAGSIGEGAATEFLAYTKLMAKLPDLDAILLDPSRASLPTEISVRYAIAIGLADRATSMNIANCATYMRRLVANTGKPGDVQPEFMVLFVRSVLQRDPTLHASKCGTIKDLFVEYQKVLT